MRVVALVAGMFFAYQAVWYWDGLAALVSGFFLFQAVTNSGCFGAQNCAVSDAAHSPKGERSAQKITYSEIKEE